MVFKIWISDSWRTVIPDKQETTEVSPVIYLTYWLEGNPRPWNRRNRRRSHLWDAPGDSGQVNTASGSTRKEKKCLHLHMTEFSMYKILEKFFKATRINK